MYKGKDKLTCPAFSFFIEHSSGKKILFDLGVRPNWETLPARIVNNVKSKGWTVKADKHVAGILEENGVPVSKGAIDTVIWSHHHFDHIGDMRTLPNSTVLTVGPGLQDEYLPGYPENQDAGVPSCDFKDHPVREISFEKEGKGLTIGRFNAFDYFGDGSFYLLDSPGHAVGHLCGLARTTAGSKPTFVFMGGDSSHHGGEFRPSEYLPIPKEISPSPVKKIQPVCPGHLLQDIHRNKIPTEPFYKVRKDFAHDIVKCDWTIEGLQEFDAHPNILLLVAHDQTVLDTLDFYPKPMNDWFEKDLAKKAKWKFLGDFSEGIQA